MAVNESEESRYQSSYGGGWVSAAQRIAEIMCERQAKSKKVDLPPKFWNLPTWKRSFMQQILAANSLLKVYKPKSILFCNIDTNHFYKWWNFTSIIDFKWNNFGKTYYCFIWFFYAIFFLCFALASTLEQHDILFIISILLGLIHLTFEIQQCLWKPKNYFNDPWNYFGKMQDYFMIFKRKKNKN